MLNEIKVKTTDIGVYAIKKTGGKKYHFFPFAEGEGYHLPSIPSCACGYYLFDAKGFTTTDDVPIPVNLECQRRALKLTQRAERKQIEVSRTKLRELGKEIRSIVDASVDIAVIICDTTLMEMMVDAYRMVDEARFASLCKELGLRKHFAEILIAKTQGDGLREQELLEMAMEGRWLK